jgi:hypothetical protein
VKTPRIVVTTLSALVLVATPVFAIVLPPLPVIDVGPEHETWLSQLVQQISMQKDLFDSLKIAIQNVTPTGADWPASTRDPQTTEPILTAEVQRLNGYIATITRQTGTPPPPDAPLKLAESAMAQLPGEEADIADAQAASDTADGDLSAQQAGHRINVIQVTNETKMRQFLYAQQLQRSADDAATMAWMTKPNTAGGDY